MKGSNRIKAVVALSAKAVTEAVFPSKCLICGSFYHAVSFPEDTMPESGIEPVDDHAMVCLTTLFNRLMAPYMCSGCSSDFIPITSPMCPRCGLMFKTKAAENHLCSKCLKTERIYETARAAGVYQTALMAAIHCLKYRGKTRLAVPLGKLLFSVFLTNWEIGTVDLVIPVPLHVKKLRKRGFNQSVLFVRDWPQWINNTYREAMGLTVSHQSVIRQKQTLPQTGLDKKERLKNVKNAFYVKSPGEIRGKRILLVDDVYTTGATLAECAEVLKKSGALKVDVLTLARTF